jgi:hypothetical protein
MMKDEHKNKYVHRYFVHFFSSDIQVARNATVNFFWLAIEMTKTTKSTKLSQCTMCFLLEVSHQSFNSSNTTDISS